MAVNPRNRKPLRTMVVLFGLIAALFMGIAGTVHLGAKNGQWTPKLALDLAGGQELILKAQVEGQSAPSADQLKQAVSIIRKRVDATGVAEAQVTTLGSDKLVISLPGTPSETVLDSLRKSSQMRFRSVLLAGPGQTAPTAAQSAMVQKARAMLGISDATDAYETAPIATGSATAPATGPAGATSSPSKGTGTTPAPASASPTTANGLLPLDDTASPTSSATAASSAPSAPAASATTAASSADPTAPAAEPYVTDIFKLSPAQLELVKIWNGSAPQPKPGKGMELTPSSSAWISPALFQFFATISCDSAPAREFIGSLFIASGQPMVACESDGSAKYLLGPSEVAGSSIKDAGSGFRSENNVQTNQIAVNIQFDDAGTKDFAKTTQRLFQLKNDPAFLSKMGLDEDQKQTWVKQFGDPNASQYVTLLEPKADDRNRFAMVLDGEVIQAPGVNSPIEAGRAEITGNFSPESGKILANQLKFGALPLSFSQDVSRAVSPQLGGEQLRWGLVAGLIGFILVVLYSLLQYRALGLVTVASLIVSGLLTYATVVLLGHFQNFRLSMAGITGLIVAIGVTADSFIVYFERVRDEVRDGRPLRNAVESGWARAKQTILISDAVNLLAALVLYFLSESNVKAFAYTLGLTTIFDVIIVFMFTHPMLTLLAGTKFFGKGHSLSGFSPEQLGATSVTYAGRGRVSIADRKAAAQGEAL